MRRSRSSVQRRTERLDQREANMSPRQRRAQRRDPKPRQSRELRAEVEQNVARINEINELYEPLREAADAELTRSAGGKKLLRDRQRLVGQLRRVQKRVEAGELNQYEAQAAFARHMEQFGFEHKERYLAAHSRHAELSPSTDAIVRALHTKDNELTHTRWSAEIEYLEAILLTPKLDTPDDAGTVQQGLGDPAPQPFGLCLRPPFARQATANYSQLGSYGFSSTTPANGSLYAGAGAVEAGGGSAQALVGGDVSVPSGLTQYEATVSLSYNYDGSSSAVLGAAGCGAGILVRIDRADGTPPLETYTPLFSLLSVVAWGNSASGTGDQVVVVPFTRASSNAGNVRVLAGASCHGDGGGLWAVSSVLVELQVSEICVRST
jgi:hypothetical protein